MLYDFPESYFFFAIFLQVMFMKAGSFEDGEASAGRAIRELYYAHDARALTEAYE